MCFLSSSKKKRVKCLCINYHIFYNEFKNETEFNFPSEINNITCAAGAGTSCSFCPSTIVTIYCTISPIIFLFLLFSVNHPPGWGRTQGCWQQGSVLIFYTFHPWPEKYLHYCKFSVSTPQLSTSLN